jgi:hypothetical protein
VNVGAASREMESKITDDTTGSGMIGMEKPVEKDQAFACASASTPRALCSGHRLRPL